MGHPSPHIPADCVDEACSGTAVGMSITCRNRDTGSRQVTHSARHIEQSKETLPITSSRQFRPFVRRQAQDCGCVIPGSSLSVHGGHQRKGQRVERKDADPPFKPDALSAFSPHPTRASRERVIHSLGFRPWSPSFSPSSPYLPSPQLLPLLLLTRPTS